ncbi:unnamed protein product [Prorocentrum cordatum]|uniref:Uncharacterized protein n=1 Tax=Prorocentrum cordatum TaxID=2364126 RepID=A0ABN9UDS5_9DINO|nr:unnamed protein product [Polarella glacialis]
MAAPASVLAELLQALAFTEKEPALSSCCLQPLADSLAAFLGALVSALEALEGAFAVPLPEHERGAALAREVEVLGTLSKMLEMASCRKVCAERQPGCRDVLARVIANHVDEHEVQVYGQWALAHLVGLGSTLDVVRPVFTNAVVLRAFLWTTADTSEELDWETKWALAQEALGTLGRHPDDVEMHQRCYQLIGARLTADQLGPGDQADPEVRRRSVLAASSVPALAHGLLRWVGAGSAGTKEACICALVALWQVYRGEGGSSDSWNLDAEARLREVEDQQRALSTALLRMSAEQAGGKLASYALDLLACTHGLPRLTQLLSSECAGAAAPRDLLWSTLASMGRLCRRACGAGEAADAVPVVLLALGDSPSSSLLELGVKVLSYCTDALCAELQGAGQQAPPAACLLERLRLCAERVAALVFRFQRERAGRWPTRSARALRAAAMADALCCHALRQSQQLREAAEARKASACWRSDSNTYTELESTLALQRTLWGAADVASSLRAALVGPVDTVPPDLGQEFFQVICYTLAEPDEQASAEDAAPVLEAVLMAADRFGSLAELESQTLGSIALALGQALRSLGRHHQALGPGQADLALRAAGALAGLLEHPLLPRRSAAASEVCGGLCAAASCGAWAQALLRAGAAEGAARVAAHLVETSGALVDPGSTDFGFALRALAEALEALQRLTGGQGGRGPAHMMAARPGVLLVQAAGLRALGRLAEDGAVPRSVDEARSLAEVARSALALHGGSAEHVRGPAERLLQRMASLSCG